MKRNKIYLIITLFCITSATYAQFGIKAGVNLANEIKSFSQADIAAGFKTSNLTGYQIGVTYQLMPKKSGLGAEIGVIVSQKGSSFTNNDSTSLINSILTGYSELNYLEIPLYLRYRLKLGFLGIYGFGGIYAGYALSSKIVTETTAAIENQSFSDFAEHLDYGLNIGAGIELFNKIQLGATWSQGLKNTVTNNLISVPTASTSTNRVFSINLVYML